MSAFLQDSQLISLSWKQVLKPSVKSRVPPSRNVPAAVQEHKWNSQMAVLHPLHQGMQISIPVSQCQPLTILVNIKIFSKSGELSTLQCCHGKTKWVGIATSGLLWVSSGHFLCWTHFGEWWLYNPVHGSSSIRCVTRALTGPERGGELPALGLCRARVCCATMMQCPVPTLQASISRAWTSWCGISWVWAAFRARQSLRKGI